MPQRFRPPCWTRAGAHGVGFSVVAAEVRKLAERSSEAAQQIALMNDESAANVRRGASVSAIADAATRQRQMAEEVNAMIRTLAGTA